MVYAQNRICPSECDAYGFGDTNRSPNFGQKTKPRVI